MSVLIFLVPITILLGLAGLSAFIWTMKNKQYDDLEGSSWRILFDEKLPANQSKKPKKSSDEEMPN